MDINKILRRKKIELENLEKGVNKKKDEIEKLEEKINKMEEKMIYKYLRFKTLVLISIHVNNVNKIMVKKYE